MITMATLLLAASLGQPTTSTSNRIVPAPSVQSAPSLAPTLDCGWTIHKTTQLGTVTGEAHGKSSLEEAKKEALKDLKAGLSAGYDCPPPCHLVVVLKNGTVQYSSYQDWLTGEWGSTAFWSGSYSISCIALPN